jgi:hypothetical protein
VGQAVNLGTGRLLRVVKAIHDGRCDISLWAAVQFHTRMVIPWPAALPDHVVCCQVCVMGDESSSSECGAGQDLEVDSSATVVDV